jgi:hypothetical protein
MNSRSHALEITRQRLGWIADRKQVLDALLELTKLEIGSGMPCGRGVCWYLKIRVNIQSVWGWCASCAAIWRSNDFDGYVDDPGKYTAKRHEFVLNLVSLLEEIDE